MSLCVSVFVSSVCLSLSLCVLLLLAHSPSCPIPVVISLFVFVIAFYLAFFRALSLSLLYPFSLVDEVSRPALHWKSTFEEHIVEARKLEHHYPHALEISIRDPSTDLSKTTFQLSGFYYNVIQYCYVYCCHH